MKTITNNLFLGLIFFLFFSCEQIIAMEINNVVQPILNSNNIIKPDSCCDTISTSKNGEININEENRINNCKEAIKEGRVELFYFVKKFENIVASISDADLLILGKKYLEKIEAGGSFTNDQIQVAAKLLLSGSVVKYIACTKLSIDNLRSNEIRQFYNKCMPAINKSYYLEIRNKDIMEAIKKEEALIELDKACIKKEKAERIDKIKK